MSWFDVEFYCPELFYDLCEESCAVGAWSTEEYVECEMDCYDFCPYQ